MAITVNWITKTFFVPQGDLTLVTGTLYELDTEVEFRQAVNAIMAGEEGIVFDDPIIHNTEVTVAGTTFARTIEVTNGYNLTFTPDAQWTVRLAGSNNNLFDVENSILNQNQVQVIAQNSGGLINASGGAPSAAQVADAVWDEAAADHVAPGSMGALQDDAAAIVVPSAADVADAVWDEPQADHLAAGSMGESQDDAASGVIDVNAIADAVWDEGLSGHQFTGTAGKALQTAADKPELNLSAVADAVWDEVAIDHLTPGSMGASQDAAASSTVDVNAIADAIWDELAATHVTSGTFGALMASIAADAKLVRQVEANRWKIDTTAFTFTVYDDDGVTPVKVFDLRDENNKPDYENVFERRPR